MKGLLYKDIVLNKVNIIAMMVILAYIIAGIVMSGFIGTPEDAKYITSMTIFGGIFALQFGFPIIAIETGKQDTKNRWSQYVLSLPVGYRSMIFERYFLSTMSNILTVILCLMLLLVGKCAYHIDIKVHALLMLFMLGIMLVVQAVFLPLVTRGKHGIVKMITIGIVILCIYGGFAYLAFGDISAFTKKDFLSRLTIWLAENEKRIWFLASLLIAAGIVLEYLTYRLSLLLHKND